MLLYSNQRFKLGQM